VLLKLVLDILDVASECAGAVDTLPCLDFELCVLPELRDIIAESDLELLELFVSRISNIFNVFLEAEKVCLKEL
jgi:hypothetical protein